MKYKNGPVFIRGDMRKKAEKMRCFFDRKSQNVSIISEKTMQNDGIKHVIYNLFTIY